MRKSVIDKKTKMFDFVCAVPDYELGAKQMFVDAVPSDDLATIVTDDEGNESASFVGVKWNGKEFVKV